MKPPDPNKSGGIREDTAALMNPSPRQQAVDVLGELVNFLRQQVRHYFTRYQTTGSHRDIRRATMMQAAVVGILEARRP